LARRCLALSRLHHAAHDDFLDFGWIYPGPLNRGFDRDGPQAWAGQTAQASLEPARGCSRRAQDDGLSIPAHQLSLLDFTGSL
jgi:hypothetical protein